MFFIKLIWSIRKICPIFLKSDKKVFEILLYIFGKFYQINLTVH